jgi:hypothetical protein
MINTVELWETAFILFLVERKKNVNMMGLQSSLSVKRRLCHL